jgi:hypothetical protein
MKKKSKILPRYREALQDIDKHFEEEQKGQHHKTVTANLKRKQRFSTMQRDWR